MLAWNNVLIADINFLKDRVIDLQVIVFTFDGRYRADCGYAKRGIRNSGLRLSKLV